MVRQELCNRHGDSIPHGKITVVIRPGQFKTIGRTHETCYLSGGKQPGMHALFVSMNQVLTRRPASRGSQTTRDAIATNF